MKGQLALGCPDMKHPTCGNTLKWVTCDARTLNFGVKEDGVEYSIWEHSGSHCSHVRPPSGRRLPGVRTVQSASPRLPIRSLSPRQSTSARQEHSTNLEFGNAGAKTKRTSNTRYETLSPPAVPPPLPIAGPSNMLAPPAARDTLSRTQRVSFKIVECDECGEPTDDIDTSSGASNGSWSCPVCRGSVVWNDAK